jgi:phosphoserine phosphatase RsbU/P
MTIKILAVDDELDMEELIRQKFRRKIRNGEYEFIFAHNGLEAMSCLLEDDEIGLILTDINMPEMDGLTLLTRVRELKKPTLKTVIISAYGDMENIRTAMNRGAFDFITKPINFEDLEITISKTIAEVENQRNLLKDRVKLLSIENELNTAREIQESILPKVFPPFPEQQAFDIYAYMHAAKSVGGDFYDFFMIDNDHLGLVIADVSGKGVPAALFMAISRTIIRTTALNGLSPDQCMKYTNNLLNKESINEMFVTAFYGILDIKTGELQYSNAGHNPPYLIRKNASLMEFEITGDIILGIIKDADYQCKTIKMEAGDTLFLFTDGVSEAENTKQELFGNPLLEKVLQDFYNSTPEELCKTMFDRVKDFAGDAEQSDDITMLALKYRGFSS